MEDIRNDLYQAVNGDELAKLEIPDDKAMYGNFIKIDEKVEKILMNDLSKMNNLEIDFDNDYQKEMINFYRLAFDFETRNNNKWSDFKKYLTKYDELNVFDDFELFILKNINTPWIFNFYVGADMKNTIVNTLYLSDPSLFLPDKSYYQKDHPSGEHLKSILKQQVKDLMLDYGFDNDKTEKIVKDAFEFDELYQDLTKTSIEKADYSANYNPIDVDILNSYSTYFDFKKFINNLLNQEVKTVILNNPRYFEKFDLIFNPNNFDKIKSWMIVNEFINNSEFLSESIRNIASSYTKAITGNPNIPNREKHAYGIVLSMFGSVIGDYYGKKYFGSDAKKDILEIVNNIIETYRKRLNRNKWLSSKTINQAMIKLNKIETLLAYPDKIKKIYHNIKININKSFFENVKELELIFIKDNLAKYKQKVDRTEWEMSASTVNAYYHPLKNLICFPAAILQAPFYSYHQSASKNYGGIGAVIAHEISHAFDNNGSKFDEFGNLKNWWLEDDFVKFDQKAKKMIELWDELTINGFKVNGALTVSENIADLGGLSCALETLKTIDNYNIKEFFENWARIWCLKIRPEFEQLLLQIDTHSPAKLRANITVAHLDDFYDVFDVKEKDAMFLDKTKRIEIW